MSKISIPCECLGKLISHRMNDTRYDVKFGYHLRFFWFFLNIQNQSVAGNVIQLIKKISLTRTGVSENST